MLFAIAAVGTQIYFFWQEGIGNLPAVVMQHPAVAVSEGKQEITARPLAPTEIIISKNLFDPERGAVKPKEAEADTRSLQRIRSFVLLGTAILGSNRYAILQEGSGGTSPTAPGRSATTVRYKIGDVIEGFSLSEIRDKNVVFSKGASRVELAPDYFRKIEPSTPSPVAQTGAFPQPGRLPAKLHRPRRLCPESFRNFPGVNACPRLRPRKLTPTKGFLRVDGGRSLVFSSAKYHV